MQKNSKPHILNLTGIRGYAAAWVVFYHYFSEITVLLPELSWISRFSSHGHLAVDLFFQLSGFVLAYNYADTFREKTRLNDVVQFVFNRFARVYPVHLATLLAVLLMYIVGKRMGADMDPAGYTWSLFIQNLFLFHAWVPKLQLSWNYPSWSVSCEWLAYLAFPFIVGRFLRLSSLRLAVGGLIATVAVTFAFLYFVKLLQFQEVARIAVHFVVGLCLYQVHSCYKVLQKHLRLLLPALLLAIVVGPNLLGHWFPYLAFAIFPLLILVLAQLGQPTRLFGSSWSVYWGEVSYALYMSHAVAQKVLYTLLPVQKLATDSLALRLAWLLVYVFVVAVSAIALHHLVENPSRKWLRRRVLPRLVRGG